MNPLPNRLQELIKSEPGLSDRELTDRLLGSSAGQQSINQAARSLAAQGLVRRHKRPDGILGNYPGDFVPPHGETTTSVEKNHDVEALSEDEIKRVLESFLKSGGWEVQVAWGKERGIDIEAFRGTHRWVIEVKGPGSRQQMRVNYFLAILGETLQRMDDPEARYSIALPDLQQYRNLWNRLPRLAKHRTQISLLLIGEDGAVTELS